MTSDASLHEIARTLRAPFVPRVFEQLAACDTYLDVVWTQLAPSVDTAGFRGSALYLADMALDAVLETYEPVLSPQSLESRSVSAEDVRDILGALDVLHWVQPQTLLICAALAEAFEADRVGGEGRPEPRDTTDRERTHLATPLHLVALDVEPLPTIAAMLQLDEAPELYRTAAEWPAYLEAAWGELQHFPAYPPLRRRARALYYYARSSARFLAQPLEANAETLAARGVPAEAIALARATVEDALPMLATMVMHCAALRAALGVADHEVVRPA